MGCQWLDEALKRMFSFIGRRIGEHPWYFIIVPALLTALCATGFQQMDYEYDPEYLFSPTNGYAKDERAKLEEYFPTNYTAFKSSRMTRVGKFSRLIVTAKDGGSMVRTSLWNQLLYLDQIVYNITVEHDGADYRYEDMCAQWMEYCYDNEILRLSDLVPDIEAGHINMTYPLFFSPYDFERFTLPAFFGGVELTEESTIAKVSAVSLSYFLNSEEDWRREVGDRWERGLLDDVQRLTEVYAPDLEVGIFVSNTPAWEMEKSRLSVTGILVFNIMAMVCFSMMAASESDAARTKTAAGLAGLLSAGLALIAGFGFCCYVGVEFISLVMAAPFLLFGIGIDDTFVTLSSWRRSPAHLSVPERMGKCYSDAAVSITVTSLTDFLSFMTGAFTPIPSVRIYCMYTGVAVAFIYVWHVTFFGGFLALAGYSEKKNRHGMLPCVEVTPKSRSSGAGWFSRAFCTGGIDPDDPHNPKDNRDHAGMVFFRDHFGAWLTKPWVKFAVLLAYGAYIVIACWGVTEVREGLEKRNTAVYDSYSVKYYDLEDAYFKEYAFTISVLFSGGGPGDESDLDFSDPATQDRIENVLRTLENSTYVDGRVTQCWLRDFLDYVDRTAGVEADPAYEGSTFVDVSSEENFARTLKETYLANPWAENNLDVAYSDDGKRVVAARFLIQGHNILDSFMEQQMVAELRDICHRFTVPGEFEVTIFQPFFIYIDQYLAIRPQTIQCVLVTALVMVIIALILIPSFICSLWIALSIVSIEIGVVGYMTWWGVNLDGVALINLIMCIGFSVDFSAHISYHYLTEADKTPDERIRGSLYALGIPILQGAGSTILGVAGLAFAPSYMFVTFFKMIFLVILLGIVHGLVLLPVLLSFFGPGSCDSIQNKKKQSSSTKSTRSSGLSTPTTFSCHISQNGGVGVGGQYRPNPQHRPKYTINMGFEGEGSASHQHQEEDSSSPEQQKTSASRSSGGSGHCHNHGHHRHHHHHHGKSRTSSRPSSSGSASSLDRDASTQKKLDYVSTLPSGYAQEYATSTPRSNNKDKEDKAVNENASKKSPKNYNSNSSSGVDVGSGGGGKEGGRGHKRNVSRSKSHMPQSYYVAPPFYQQQLPTGIATSPSGVPHSSTEPQLVAVLPPGGDPSTMTAAEHQMLRKYHSFPYHVFTNDANEYSSDDSNLSGGVGGRGHGGGGRRPPHHHHRTHQDGIVLRAPRLGLTSEESGATSSSSTSPNNVKKR